MSDLEKTFVLSNRNAMLDDACLRGIPELPPNLPLLLDVDTAARIGSCSKRCIRNKLRKGEIKGIKTGREWRINRDDYLRQLGLIK